MNPNRQSTTVPTEGWFRHLPARGLRPVLVSRELGAFHEWAISARIPAYQDALPWPSKTNPLPFVRSMWNLRKIVRRHDIELIHCNEQDIYPVGQLLARLCRLPIVVSVHCRMMPPFCRWAFSGKRCPDRIFFISRGNMEACREGVESCIPKSRWRLLYNGLDVTKFQPSVEEASRFRAGHNLGQGPLVGVACALRPGKQLEQSFQAVANCGSAEVKFVLAGGPIRGFEDYAAEVLATGRRLLGERFVHLGHVSDVNGFYNALDFCVNTSEGEACSISILESLSCGCPVVGYPSISVHEQVLPDGGEIVPQSDVRALADALGRWTSDRRGLLGRREDARKRAVDVFDIRKLADDLWLEYAEVLGNSEGRVSPSAAARSKHSATSVGV
jgi:glycosyltransferase involved in cell wall biosynthesis